MNHMLYGFEKEVTENTNCIKCNDKAVDFDSTDVINIGETEGICFGCSQWHYDECTTCEKFVDISELKESNGAYSCPCCGKIVSKF